MRRLGPCKTLLLSVAIALSLTGCPTAQSPSQPNPPTIVAPGYGSPADQKLGQSLAALRMFAAKAKEDYNTLTPSQQSEEKIPLNSLILAVDAADTVYKAYHNGLRTIEDAQNAYDKAAAEQSAYTHSAVGVN